MYTMERALILVGLPALVHLSEVLLLVRVVREARRLVRTRVALGVRVGHKVRVLHDVTVATREYIVCGRL
jgi:hypothetical protein